VPAPKKRGFFAKFGSDTSAAGNGNNGSGNATEEVGTAMSRFLPLPSLGGRKGAQSGAGQGQQLQGAELRAMPVAGLGSRQPQEVEV
jgi:hypothetical protein